MKVVNLCAGVIVTMGLVACDQPPDTGEDRGPGDPGSATWEAADETLPSPLIEGNIELGYRMVTTDSPRPVVLLMGGFGTSYKAYNEALDHLTSHGYHTVGVDLPRIGALYAAAHDRSAMEITAVIDHIVSGASPLGSRVRSDQIAMAGHSLGGKIAFYAASLDPRIRLVLAMDPSNSGGPPCFIDSDGCHAFPVADNPETGQKGVMDSMQAASVIFRAPPDLLTNPDKFANAINFWHSLPTTGYLFDFPEARHASWVGNAGIQQITNRTMVAMLQQTFDGKDSSLWFSAATVAKDAADGVSYTISTK